MHPASHVLRTWADEQHIPDLTLAELDYRLTHAPGAIFSDRFLRDRLCLKGGTALNKLFFPAVNRLSVDLDFNAVGPRQHFKLEMSFIERVPILGQLSKLLAMPAAEPAVAVSTYQLEELAATKLRALYGRRKGRDIYDLAQIEHPIAWLMAEIPITPEAADLRADDLRPFVRE